MSEIREPPKDLWWYCRACGMSNGPRDVEFCAMCGGRKEDVILRRSASIRADAEIVRMNRAQPVD